jgi:thiamine-phosphate pyrophosphorylase
VIECYITDRHSLHGESLLDSIARNLQRGVTWIQLREKDLSERELLQLLLAASKLPNPRGTKWIVNTRVDVALAASADGVHFPASSPDPSPWLPLLPPGFLVGASCHTLEELARAERMGATYATFAPVFSPLSKVSEHPPHGIEALRAATRATRLPVIALGGITRVNTQACMDAGAAGVAAISLYQSPTPSC